MDFDPTYQSTLDFRVTTSDNPGFSSFLSMIKNVRVGARLGARPRQSLTSMYQREVSKWPLVASISCILELAGWTPVFQYCTNADMWATSDPKATSYCTITVCTNNNPGVGDDLKTCTSCVYPEDEDEKCFAEMIATLVLLASICGGMLSQHTMSADSIRLPHETLHQ